MIATFAVLGAAVLWGLGAQLEYAGLKASTTTVFVTVKALVILLLFAAALAATYATKESIAAPKRSMLIAAATGVMSAGAVLCYMYALRSSGSVTNTISLTYPLSIGVAVAAGWAMGEKPSTRQCVGVAAAVFATALLAGAKPPVPPTAQ